MSEQTFNPLQKEVDELFAFALDRTANCYPLKPFHRLLQQSHQRLQEPLRIAIVGLIKAGKSTMMNALLGQSVVATGSVEATFNVNWLKYGEKPRLIVHFKDEQRQPEEKSFAELAALTLRAEENRDYLLKIQYIEVFYPNDILKEFNIIDTPGLNSSYVNDSDNTKEFLQMHGEELTLVTQQQASNADAVLYLFSHSLGQFDANILEQLQGPLMGNTTPINAIGVLTKVDFYATDPNIPDPLAKGQELAQRLREQNQVRRLFYTIQPLCGLLALGAKTLTPEHWEILQELAKLPPDRFEALNRNVAKFVKDYDDVPIPPSHRAKVLAQLEQYGLTLAYGYIRSGVSSREELGAKLLEHSGLDELRHLLLSHFGRRALLIKLGNILGHIEAAYFQERQRLEANNLAILEEITGKFQALRSKEHAFQELDVLRSYYEGKLDFDEVERKQLLQITGEDGISCGERLGLGERATIDEMIPVARSLMHSWRTRADDYMSSDRSTIHAAGILARSYERILYRVQKAREYLYV
jgi:GTPase SAR1 family protein